MVRRERIIQLRGFDEMLVDPGGPDFAMVVIGVEGRNRCGYTDSPIARVGQI